MMSGIASSAAVVAVGDELLEGDHPDTNSAEIARALLQVGRQAQRFLVLRDEEEELARELARLCIHHGTVIVTGGLGPTLDDITRHAVARAAGVELERSEEAWRQICAWFERARRPMADSNARQALMPRGARVLANGCGTAPGFHLRVGEAELFALPGPPREMRPMLADEVLPYLALRPIDGWRRVERSFFLVDLSESLFADRVGAWMERGANPLMTVTAKAGVLSVRLVARGRDESEARELLEARAAELRERFQEHLFSEESPALELALARELEAGGLSISLAESCTGGMIAAALTNVPGISAWLGQAYVTYSNRAKVELLGVDPRWIEAHGAVSLEVARAMARGAAERARARLALGVTGVAGPAGGSAAHPVGLVCFATALDGEVDAHERRFPPAGREQVRLWATQAGLAALWKRARGANRPR